MSFSLPVGKSAPFLDETATPIPDGSLNNASVADGAIATIVGLNGILGLHANAIGQTEVTLERGGQPVTHTVSVIASPFDWSLGSAV